MANEISIIIPCYCNAESLRKLIDSIRADSTELSYEIIIADSSSEDQIAEAVTEMARVRHLKLPHRCTPGVARNAGAAKANGRVLVFVDADMELRPGTLDGIGRHYFQDGFRFFGGSIELPCEPRPCFWTQVEQAFFQHESQATRSPGLRKNLSGGLMVIGRDLFNDVTGFQDIPRLQDTEFSERVVKAGQPAYFFPDLGAYHHHPSDRRSLLRKVWINGHNIATLKSLADSRRLRRFLLISISPILGLLKGARIVGRNLRYGIGGRRSAAVLTSPAVMLCSIWWGLAMLRAAIRNEGFSRSR